MSGITRTLDLHTLKTRQLVMQNADGSFPPVNSVLAFEDSRGHIIPSLDLKVTSVTANTIEVSDLSANTIEVGDLSANTIEVGDLSANTIEVDDLSANTIHANTLSFPNTPLFSFLPTTATTAQIVLSYNSLLSYLSRVKIINTAQTTIFASPVGSQLLASTDRGVSWTSTTLTGYTLDHAYGMVWNGSLWVAAGRGPTPLLWSSNGIDWNNCTSSSSGFGSNPDGADVNWNGTIFVATFAIFPGTSNAIWTSIDGKVWTPNTSITCMAYSVTWNGTIWLVTGQAFARGRIYTATDPTGTWTDQSNYNITDMGSIYSAVYDGSKWVVAGRIRNSGQKSILYADETWDWQYPTGVLFRNAGRSIAWNGTVFVVAGSDNPFTYSIIYSYDGINWMGVPKIDGTTFTYYGNSVSWIVDRFVAVGYDTLAGPIYPSYSLDGITWKKSTGTALVQPTPNFNLSVSRNYSTP